MERYDSYNDSGVEWLGQVPSHWEVSKMRAHFSERKGLSETGTELLLSVSEYKGITPSTNESGENISRSESLTGYKKCFTGDLIINIMLAWKRGLGVSTYNGIVSPAYCVFQTNRINPTYADYLLRTDLYIAEFKRNSSGIIESRLRMYPDDFKNIPCLLPPPKEQTAIVDYLDKTIGDIDEAIAAQQKMIDLLNERKQIIITRAVTRGLNPDVKLKDSGNDWLDQIPEHWDAIPVRHFFEFKNGYTPSKANPSFWTNGTIPWFRMEDIRKSGRILEKAIQYVTPSAVNNGGTFDAGSFILAICTASIGEHAMLIADSLANQQFANLKIRKSLSNRTMPMFIFYYLYILGRYCKDTANTTTFQYADMNLVKNFKVPLPSPEEQQMIVDYLEHNFKGIEKAIEQHKNMISLLQERKQIIISEVVTGKVKVS